MLCLFCVIRLLQGRAMIQHPNLTKSFQCILLRRSLLFNSGRICGPCGSALAGKPQTIFVQSATSKTHSSTRFLGIDIYRKQICGRVQRVVVCLGRTILMDHQRLYRSNLDGPLFSSARFGRYDGRNEWLNIAQ